MDSCAGRPPPGPLYKARGSKGRRTKVLAAAPLPSRSPPPLLSQNPSRPLSILEATRVALSPPPPHTHGEALPADASTSARGLGEALPEFTAETVTTPSCCRDRIYYLVSALAGSGRRRRHRAVRVQHLGDTAAATFHRIGSRSKYGTWSWSTVHGVRYGTPSSTMTQERCTGASTVHLRRPRSSNASARDLQGYVD